MIYLYNQNPTVGMRDGVKVSTGEDFENALEFKLNSVSGEAKSIKCAVRCDEGYKVDGDALITIEGAGAERFALSLDDVSYGEFGASLSIGGVQDDNVIVYVKCASVEGETPTVSTAVKIAVEGTITVK